MLKPFENPPIMQAFREWEKHLLLNHPRLWALRLPQLLVYLVFANALALLISGLIPLKTYQVNYLFLWLWLFGLLEVILLILWITHFNRHSPEKALERTNPLNGLAEVLIYMLCVAVILSPAISSSFLLVQRFSHLLPSAEVNSDHLTLRDYEYRDVYSEALVEKYSPLDYATYLADAEEDNDKHWSNNQYIRNTVNELYDLSDGESYAWKTYLVVGIVLLHIGAVMFSTRHLRKGVFGKVVIYAILTFIAALILYGIADTLISDLIPGSYTQKRDYYDMLGRGMFILLAVFFAVFSFRVFWQKRYREFTAMNISLLPYVLYIEIFYFDSNRDGLSYIGQLFSSKGWLYHTFGSYWGDLLAGLIVATPLLILWVFILTKAMYTRLMALPEG